MVKKYSEEAKKAKRRARRKAEANYTSNKHCYKCGQNYPSNRYHYC